jgi:5-methyltetrahydropteroyltriglutamate--homocysteine methyltransferase
MRIRDNEVLLPTTIVGAYPRPLFMHGTKVFSWGADAPEFPSYWMREQFYDAVALATKDQLDAGLDIVSDGQQHYETETPYEFSELHHYVPSRLQGYKAYGDPIPGDDGLTPVYMPTVEGPIRWVRPIAKPIAEAVRAATPAPFKHNLGWGPVVLSDLSTDNHYHDQKALAMDLAKALNQEMKDLAARGADLIQVAEPLGFYESEPWMLDAINVAFEGVSAYRVVHICYVLNEGQSAIGEPQAERLLPMLRGIDCEQIHFQQAARGFSEVSHLRDWPSDKDLGVGVIDVQRTPAEDPAQIAAWIRATLEIVPPERLCISSDCGMGSFRSRVVARKKLRAMARGTQIVRAELTGEQLEQDVAIADSGAATWGKAT